MKALSKLIPYIFAICCLGVFGGAVNLGGFSFFPAIPYLLIAIIISLKKSHKYKFILLVTFLISIPSYYLKLRGGKLFFPALHKEIVTTVETCLVSVDEIISENEKTSSAHIFAKHTNKECAKFQNDSLFLPVGSKLKIDSIVVSNADFGERYIIRSHTKKGLLYFPLWKNKIFKFKGGDLVEESDLYRNIFYYPSLLMYGPALILFF